MLVNEHCRNQICYICDKQTGFIEQRERERQQKAERESVFLSMRRASQAETAREPTLLYCTLAICFVCFKCSKDDSQCNDLRCFFNKTKRTKLSESRSVFIFSLHSLGTAGYRLVSVPPFQIRSFIFIFISLIVFFFNRSNVKI